MGFDVYRLSNITLIFLPANTTSIVQPLDQGIIAAFKAHYRALVQFVISGSKPRHDDAAGQDQRQAVKWVRHASRALTTATIRNCWWKAGILGRTKYQRHRPVRATSQRVQVTAAASDAGDPEASASNDVVMQDAEVAPDTEVHGEAPAAGYEALEEDLNSLAALVARRPGVLEDGDTLLSAIDFADLPGEDEGLHL
jgi:hypothetical protein